MVATGLDVTYPRRHDALYANVRDRGLIVSEHAYGVQPHAAQFPVRNRIIAALCDVCVVVEAKAVGGATITADYADQYGRTVFALPGARRNDAAVGCNALIKDGAQILLDPGDILVELGAGRAGEHWQPRLELPSDPDDRRVFQSLAGEPASVDQLAGPHPPRDRPPRRGAPAARAGRPHRAPPGPLVAAVNTSDARPTGAYRVGVGFNPFGKRAQRRSDIFIVVLAFVSSRCSCCGRRTRDERAHLDRGDEGWDDGEDVRHVQPYEAVKPYRCPGCDHEIRPGEGHEVVVPAPRPKTAGTGTPAAGAPSAPRAARRSARRSASQPVRTRLRARRRSSRPARPACTEATSKRSSGSPRRLVGEPQRGPASATVVACAASRLRRAGRTHRCAGSSPRRTRACRRRRAITSISPSRTRQLRSTTS